MIISYVTRAQEKYSINGTVKSGKDSGLPGATIFLDGTEKKTYSNEKGEFKLDGLLPGTYQLTVHFVGYNAVKQNVIIVDKAITLKIDLKPSEETLQEVVITSPESISKYLGLFLRNFLGDTKNGNSCRISNPELIRFSENGAFVTAKTNDFLEIVNDNLGYKIKYLLRDFRINRITSVTSYTGECVYENLKGTSSDEERWAEQREKAYHGSFLHFMRSLYNHTTEKDGFSCRFLIDQNMITQRLSDKVEMEKLTKFDKKQLLVLRFLLPLYVEYLPSNQVNASEENSAVSAYKKFKDGKGSILKPYLDNALIDKKGSLVDYKSFLIQMNWGAKRIGDQLPYEYVPNILCDCK